VTPRPVVRSSFGPMRYLAPGISSFVPGIGSGAGGSQTRRVSMTEPRGSTKERILNAAWKRLLHGDRARLEDVAADAGVSRQAVYLHFGSRGGLLLALVDHIDATFGLQERLAEVASEAVPTDRLDAMLRLMADYNGEIHGIAMAFARQAQDDPEVRAAFEDRMERRRAGLLRIVKALEQDGRLRTDWTCEEVADILWELGSPSSFEHLVTERGWTTERFGDWLLWAARSFLG